MDTQYIHYGNDHMDVNYNYDTDIEKNTLKCKPPYGVWASRVDSNFGWKDWCEAEDFGDLSISCKFTLKPSANILEIHEEEDILPYIVNDYKSRLNEFYTIKTKILDEIDWNTLMKKYDGLEVFMSHQLHMGVFNTWDCDSLVIWNLSVIEQ